MPKDEIKVKISKNGRVSIPNAKFGSSQSNTHSDFRKGLNSATFTKRRSGIRGDK